MGRAVVVDVYGDDTCPCEASAGNGRRSLRCGWQPDIVIPPCGSGLRKGGQIYFRCVTLPWDEIACSGTAQDIGRAAEGARSSSFRLYGRVNGVTGRTCMRTPVVKRHTTPPSGFFAFLSAFQGLAQSAVSVVFC